MATPGIAPAAPAAVNPVWRSSRAAYRGLDGFVSATLALLLPPVAIVWAFVWTLLEIARPFALIIINLFILVCVFGVVLLAYQGDWSMGALFLVFAGAARLALEALFAFMKRTDRDYERAMRFGRPTRW